MRALARPLALACALAPLGLAACTAPFSDQQSARVLPRGEVELGAHLSSYTFTAEGETETVQSDYGLQLGAGVAPRTELRLRYGYLKVDDADFAAHAFGFGPKFELSPDAIAFYSPLGFATGDDIESGDSWHWMPTVLLSSQYGPSLETTLGLKAIFPFESEGETTLAANFGLAFGPDVEHFAIRPEFGLQFNPGDEGFFTQFSLGVSYSPAYGR